MRELIFGVNCTAKFPSNDRNLFLRFFCFFYFLKAYLIISIIDIFIQYFFVFFICKISNTMYFACYITALIKLILFF